MHAMVNLSLFDRIVSKKNQAPIFKLLISALLKFLFGSKCLIPIGTNREGKTGIECSF